MNNPKVVTNDKVIHLKPTDNFNELLESKTPSKYSKIPSNYVRDRNRSSPKGKVNYLDLLPDDNTFRQKVVQKR